MKSGKVALGLLAGLAVGAVLGILFAPDKGEKTRKKISGKAKDVKDKMEKAVEGFGKKAEEFKDMAIEQFTDAEKTIKSKSNA